MGVVVARPRFGLDGLLESSLDVIGNSLALRVEGGEVGVEVGTGRVLVLFLDWEEFFPLGASESDLLGIRHHLGHLGIQNLQFPIWGYLPIFKFLLALFRRP